MPANRTALGAEERVANREREQGMLSQKENEFLCQVSPGTPMGELLRQYWIPALQSKEVPAADGPPLRFRILGENLIAFRVTSGQVGIVQNACPHRGASLFFGRNEEEGLRCVYHGWKFDVAGQCVDMPSEPAESNFKSKVKARAYPVIERNGVIWAYMGPRMTPPPLWDLEFNVVPEGHCRIGMNVRECNFVQAVEGGIDSAHSAILHSQVDKEKFDTTGVREFVFQGRSHQPLRYDTRVTEAGVLGGARREAAEPGYDWWRVNVFIMPFYTMFPGSPDGTLSGHAFVPIDDDVTMCWNISWNPGKPLDAGRREQGQGQGTGFAGTSDGGYLPDTTDWTGRWRMTENASNDYLRDYEAEKTMRFSGIVSINLQDSGIQESMGPIIDRTKEHLGAIDAMIIQMRRRMMRSAQALLETGESPAEVDNPSVVQLRALQMILSRDRDWIEVGGDWMFGRSKEPPEEAKLVSRAPRDPLAIPISTALTIG
jgi:phenylpropionate dioxygenase-like ring-hydroxylating dioxygenase large terminal subunit